MGRHTQPEIKARILEACTSHALEHGLPDRLEPLATAAGTSARMLIYHFGTRDALLRAVLVRARQRQLELFGQHLRARPGTPYAATLAHAWSVMSGVEGRPYLRLFGPLRRSTEQHLWPDFHREATTDWLPLLDEGLSTTPHPGLATLTLAVIRGLLMDLDATEDTQRTDRAFHQFLEAVLPASPRDDSR